MDLRKWRHAALKAAHADYIDCRLAPARTAAAESAELAGIAGFIGRRAAIR
jgi:hypothetical protein